MISGALLDLLVTSVDDCGADAAHVVVEDVLNELIAYNSLVHDARVKNKNRSPKFVSISFSSALKDPSFSCFRR